eukprot:jgi/Bigna1/125519/aug1.1_g227
MRLRLGPAVCRPQSRLFSTLEEGRTVPVVGCGSNVVDVFFKVRSMPKPSTKVYFADPCKAEEGKVVGGVTLNHLAWASLMGAPTGLLALQGEDDYGKMIRKKMEDLGVSTRYLKKGPEYATSVCHILLDSQGERAIIMAPASTGHINATAMKTHFAEALNAATIVTTEISQVPLSGVLQLLNLASSSSHAATPLSMLDVDVPPSVAAGEANLGSLNELLQCVKTEGASCCPKEAGVDISDMEIDDVAVLLKEAFGSRLVAVTDGKRGCGLAAERGGEGSSPSPSESSSSSTFSAQVGAYEGVHQVDSTGAGDAFFGGMVAGLYRLGRLPETEAELAELGAISSAAGAACVEVLGALPDMDISPRRVVELAPTVEDWLQMSPLSASGEGASGASFSAFSPSDESGTIAGSSGLNSLECDAKSLQSLATKAKEETQFTQSLDELCKRIYEMEKNETGRVLITGIGKSGYVARRMAATLASLSIPSHFVHASEWGHGDFGNARKDDIVVMLSHSGNTEELVGVLHGISNRGIYTAVIVGNENSELSRGADVTLIASISEEETLGVVPSRSIISQEAVVNAIASEIVHRSRFSKEDFRMNHPGGSLGNLLKQAAEDR